MCITNVYKTVTSHPTKSLSRLDKTKLVGGDHLIVQNVRKDINCSAQCRVRCSSVPVHCVTI